ncbi:MAG TPA: ABC transporter permease subunit [Ignavibacteria bacterium]|nr:ABC transporter permease subunit [Ignavibacteria bacterium]HQY53259.1 ABC transporter permease subunit [Ignavibacteria bacterium]HRB01333.1 ABC transporter permease subunit [Ignavibacteria bacterium]
MIFSTLVLSTFREAMAKKIFLGFFAISTIIILIFLFLINVDSVEGMVDMVGASGEEGIRKLVIGFEVAMIDISYLLIITFCLISVSSFIPSMLEKGNIDLLLSKPISRTNIILAKFIGGVLLVFISLIYLIGFVWIILSSKSGFWHFPFLYSILWLTLSFAVIYSLIIFIGLISQSTILSILVSFFLVFIVCPILYVREATIFSLVENSAAQFVINFFYYILPKPSDINKITTDIITGEAVNSYMPVFSSVLFMLAVLSASIFYFKKKDY